MNRSYYSNTATEVNHHQNISNVSPSAQILELAMPFTGNKYVLYKEKLKGQTLNKELKVNEKYKNNTSINNDCINNADE